MSACRVCDGDGKCHDEYHRAYAIDPISAIAEAVSECPECGGSFQSPGKCRECDGTGEED